MIADGIGAKIRPVVFVESFSRTLRVMDVHAEIAGILTKKVCFPVAPVMGRNLLTPGHPGKMLTNVHRKPGPKILSMPFCPA